MKKVTVRIPGLRRFLKRRDQDTKRNGRLHKFVDGSAKIVAAGAIVAAAIIANTFQSKMSTIGLLSQRELAESQLRGVMFGNLISPIIGPKNANTECDPRREQLLAELLALNFHEHFETKPLMLHVRRRIHVDPNIDDEEKKELRSSLESIARRVSARQVATLRLEGGAANAARIQRLKCAIIEANDKNAEQNQEIERKYYEKLRENFDTFPIKEFTTVKSPDEKWALEVTITEINPEESDIYVEIDVRSTREIDPAQKEKPSDQNGTKTDNPPLHLEFKLTYYDFPLTDNTILGDGNRFAMVLDDIYARHLPLFSSQDICSKDQANVCGDPMIYFAEFSLIWFPKDYFTPRERPINYSTFLEEIGVKSN